MIGGLVLAAGKGSRFGGAKQVALVDGKPLVVRAAEALAGVEAVGRVVVVAGAHAYEVSGALSESEAHVVVAANWREGMAASLRAGVEELASCETIVVTLADQPFVTGEVVTAVLEGIGPAPAARATYGGAPGHPVVLTHDTYDAVMALRGDVGARDLLERVGAVTVECAGLADPLDVDTPDDLVLARETSNKERA